MPLATYTSTFWPAVPQFYAGLPPLNATVGRDYCLAPGALLLRLVHLPFYLDIHSSDSAYLYNLRGCVPDMTTPGWVSPRTWFLRCTTFSCLWATPGLVRTLRTHTRRPLHWTLVERRLCHAAILVRRTYAAAHPLIRVLPACPAYRSALRSDNMPVGLLLMRTGLVQFGLPAVKAVTTCRIVGHRADTDWRLPPRGSVTRLRTLPLTYYAVTVGCPTRWLVWILHCSARQQPLPHAHATPSSLFRLVLRFGPWVLRYAVVTRI